MLPLQDIVFGFKATALFNVQDVIKCNEASREVGEHVIALMAQTAEADNTPCLSWAAASGKIMHLAHCTWYKLMTSYDSIHGCQTYIALL